MTTAFNWRDQSADVLEQHYNPRATVANVQQYLDDFAARSATAREQVGGEYDLRFGDNPKETLDLHKANDQSPLLLFIHGGFWRALDKSDHSFVVPFFLDAGISVANINYDLCPTVTLDVIVEEMKRALPYCYQQASEWGVDPNRIYVAGHSAGAHLAAMLLAEDWTAAGLPVDVIKGGILLSGVYEPEVICHITVNEEAKISQESAVRNNCLQRPPYRKVPILVAAGADEPEGWQQLSHSYAESCQAAGIETDLILSPGANHFSLLEQAVTPGDPLARAILALINA